MLRPMRALALAAGIALAAPAAARPFTVDDMLRQESLGAGVFDPSGRWYVFEQRDRYDTAARYDLSAAIVTALSRLRVAEVSGDGPARPLISPDPGPGVVLGSFSPSGARLAVFRFQDRRWTLGVVEMARGTVRWLDIRRGPGPSSSTVSPMAWMAQSPLKAGARTGTTSASSSRLSMGIGSTTCAITRERSCAGSPTTSGSRSSLGSPPAISTPISRTPTSSFGVAKGTAGTWSSLEITFHTASGCGPRRSPKNGLETCRARTRSGVSGARLRRIALRALTAGCFRAPRLTVSWRMESDAATPGLHSRAAGFGNLKHLGSHSGWAAGIGWRRIWSGSFERCSSGAT